MTSKNLPPRTLAEIFERKEQARAASRALPLFTKMEMAVQMYRDREALGRLVLTAPADEQKLRA